MCILRYTGWSRKKCHFISSYFLQMLQFPKIFLLGVGYCYKFLQWKAFFKCPLFFSVFLIINNMFDPSPWLLDHGCHPASTPWNYLLWGYLKERVYQDNPDTIGSLKQNIRREIRRIPRDMLERVMDNFNVRMAAVIQQRGAWIKHTTRKCEEKSEYCKNACHNKTL